MCIQMCIYMYSNIFIERKRYLAHYIILHIYIYMYCCVFEDNNIHLAPLIFDQISLLAPQLPKTENLNIEDNHVLLISSLRGGR